jgi:hypothetical protein
MRPASWLRRNTLRSWPYTGFLAKPRSLVDFLVEGFAVPGRMHRADQVQSGRLPAATESLFSRVAGKQENETRPPRGGRKHFALSAAQAPRTDASPRTWRRDDDRVASDKHSYDRT